MLPQFSDTNLNGAAPIRTDGDGNALMPEWSDGDPKPMSRADRRAEAARVKADPEPRKRVARDLQPDATDMDSVTQAQEWLAAHPEEAAMLRAAQGSSTGDILADAGLIKRYYSSTEAAAFFDKTVQWLYWGMRHPPHGGRLFVEPVLDERGVQLQQAVDATTREPVDPENLQPGQEVEWEPMIRDIPVERLDNRPEGKRRFDIETIRKFAISAYHQANIKEPKLRAVLERLIVAEHGGNWKAIPIPTRKKEDEDSDGSD